MMPPEDGHPKDANPDDARTDMRSEPVASSTVAVEDHLLVVGTLGNDARIWARVAALSFGGPAGQVAVMHRIIVDEQRWLSEDRFLHALNYCMLLPGPEAQQLATYIGWLRHGIRGGLLAGGLFILPGFVSILVLSILYAEYQQLPAMTGLFLGLKAAVMAIVVEAVLRIGRRVLKHRSLVVLAGGSFLAIFLWRIPFPVLIAVAAALGVIGHRWAPQLFAASNAHGPAATRTPQPPSAVTLERAATTAPLHSHWRQSLVILAVCLGLWFGPLGLIRHQLGAESIWYQEGMFFSQVAVVTFGGAYAVLAYVAQQAVEQFGWLQPGEMLDGLGLAETTPGPLIMVLQFVGFLAAYRQPGPFSPLAAGVLGAVVTTWVTFVPCFCWIFLGAPYVERLRNNRQLAAALSAITAAVVGVILNLAVWFSLHTLFERVDSLKLRGLTVPVPDWTALNSAALLIALVAFALTFVLKRGLAVTLLVCGVLGLLAVGLPH